MDLILRLGRATAILVAAGALSAGFVNATASTAKTKAPAAAIDDDGISPRFSDYLAGRIAQLDRDWRSAAQLMRAAWEADRANVALRHDVLLLSVSGGDVPAAAAVARIVAPDSSDAQFANLILLIDDLANGRYAAAEGRLTTGPAQGIDRYLTPVMTAWAEVGQGHKAAAMAAVAPLEKLDGAGEIEQVQLAMIHEALGDKAGAAAIFDHLVAGKLSPRVIRLAAHFYERTGAPDKARAAVEKLDADGVSASLRAEMLARLTAKNSSSATPNPRSGAADAMFDIAGSIQGREANSIAPLLYVQLALYLDPNFPEAQLLLSDIQQHAARTVDAVATLEGVDQASDLRTTAVRAAMATLARNNQLDDAIKLGHAAVEAHPEDIDLSLLYADLLRQKQRYADAVAVYDAVLPRIAATSSRRGVALFHRGMAYQQAHQWPKAEADLQAALMLRPDDPGLLNYLAFSWADQGINLDRARTMLERAVQLSPDDGAIVDSLGWVMFQAGDYADAVKQLEHAVELDQDDATINDHLGDAYWRAGRQIEARSQWERALRETEDKALLEQIRVKLQNGLAQQSPRRASLN